MITSASGPGARARVRVTGALERVQAAGPDRAPTLRAELADGADRVTIIWLGRSRIAGIEPGRVLAVEGTLTHQRGQKIIYNPRYELDADQARGRAP